MFRNKSKWLGVGAVAVGLSLPFAAQAHADDEAMAFVVGAAVGYAIGDQGSKHRHVHYRGHPKRYEHDRWRGYYEHPRYAHRRWARSHGEWHHHARGYHRDRYSKRGHYRDHRDRDRHAGKRHRDGRGAPRG
jgi:hypothetical protein